MDNETTNSSQVVPLQKLWDGVQVVVVQYPSKMYFF